MQFYWKCSECDEENDYSLTKVCETCGADIPDSEERRIQREIKLEAERKERERIERIKREEAEQKRRLEERLRKLEEERQRKLLEDRRKISGIIKQSCRIPSIVMRSLIGVALTAAIVICVVNHSNLNFINIPKSVFENISSEFDAHMDVIEVDKTSENNSEDKSDDNSEKKEEETTETEKQKIPHFANNIQKEYRYLTENFNPEANFQEFFDGLTNSNQEDE